jgi:hypothetical protein
MRSTAGCEGAPFDARRDADDTPLPRALKDGAGLLSRAPAAMYGAG